MSFKTVEEMTGPEVVLTAENLADYAVDCREIEQGINTKESVRFRKCMSRIETEKLTSPINMASLHIRWNQNLSKHYELLLSLFKGGGTLDAMRTLFGPVEAL